MYMLYIGTSLTDDIVTGNCIQGRIQGRSKQSSCSGFARPLFLKVKKKTPFYKRRIINKSTKVIFGLVQLFILQYGREKSI